LKTRGFAVLADRTPWPAYWLKLPLNQLPDGKARLLLNLHKIDLDEKNQCLFDV